MKLQIPLLLLTMFAAGAAPLPAVRIDQARFVTGDPPAEFRPWGLNYGNAGRLTKDERRRIKQLMLDAEQEAKED